MLSILRTLGILLALWCACCLQAVWTQGEPSCDTTQIPFGCVTDIASHVLVSIAADAPEILPLQVTHRGAAAAAAAAVVARLSATDSPRAAVELTAWDATNNSTTTGTIETRAAGRELCLSSPGGPIVLEQGSARITIDGETGCVLINGTLPAKSPCRETMLAAATPTASSGGGGSTTQDRLSEPLITGWMLAVVIIATLILGCLGGCFMGMWIYKKRLRPMSNAPL